MGIGPREARRVWGWSVIDADGRRLGMVVAHVVNGETVDFLVQKRRFLQASENHRVNGVELCVYRDGLLIHQPLLAWFGPVQETHELAIRPHRGQGDVA